MRDAKLIKEIEQGSLQHGKLFGVWWVPGHLIKEGHSKVVINIAFNIRDSSLESSNPDDEGGKRVIDLLRSSPSQVIAMVNMFGAIKANNLLDLPKQVHRAELISLRDIRLLALSI